MKIIKQTMPWKNIGLNIRTSKKYIQNFDNPFTEVTVVFKLSVYTYALIEVVKFKIK